MLESPIGTRDKTLFKQNKNKLRICNTHIHTCIYTMSIYITCVYTMCIYTTCVYTMCIQTTCLYTMCIRTMCIYTMCIHITYDVYTYHVRCVYRVYLYDVYAYRVRCVYIPHTICIHNKCIYTMCVHTKCIYTMCIHTTCRGVGLKLAEYPSYTNKEIRVSRTMYHL